MLRKCIDKSEFIKTILQWILWRERPGMTIQTYELKAVTYGTTPISFVSIRCLQNISEVMKNVFPLGSIVEPIIIKTNILIQKI